MDEDTKAVTSTDILVRAFIAAFILPIFYISPDASYLTWHVSVVILFLCLFWSFSLLKDTERMLAMSLILFPAIFILFVLMGSLGVISATGSVEFASFFSILLGLISIVAAFLWPKRVGDELIAGRYQIGEEVVLILGHTTPIGETASTQELTTLALILEVDEVRLKLQYRDLDGKFVEDWHPFESIRSVEDSHE